MSAIERRESQYIQTDTAVTRGDFDDVVIRGHLKPQKGRNTNVLLVGVGFRSATMSHLSCPFQPYQIAASFEAQGAPYTMKVVDIAEEPIVDLRKRRKVYLELGSHNSTDAGVKKLRQAWQRFCRYTNQDPDILAQTYEEDMVFDMDINEWPGVLRTSLSDGILAAQVPASFAEGLASGKITTQVADIARPDLDLGKDIDYATIMYVLCYLPPDQQKSALTNIHRCLREGGLCLVNDRPVFNHPLFEEFGGWLTEIELSKLGFEVVSVLEQDIQGNHAVKLLRKKTVVNEVPVITSQLEQRLERTHRGIQVLLKHAAIQKADFETVSDKMQEIGFDFRLLLDELRADLLLGVGYWPASHGEKVTPPIIFRAANQDLLSVFPPLKAGILRRPIKDLVIPQENPPIVRAISNQEDLFPGWISYAFRQKKIMTALGCRTEDELQSKLVLPAIELSLSYVPTEVFGDTGNIDFSQLRIEDRYQAGLLGTRENPVAVIVDFLRSYHGDEVVRQYLLRLQTSAVEFQRAAWLHIVKPYEAGAFGQGKKS